MINFPYVGRIGLTEDELARDVERRLVELKILADPLIKAETRVPRQCQGNLPRVILYEGDEH